MKVPKKDYEDIGECIRSDQVPAHTVAEYFFDEQFLRWYKKRYKIRREYPTTSGNEWIDGYRKWKNEKR